MAFHLVWNPLTHSPPLPQSPLFKFSTRWHGAEGYEFDSRITFFLEKSENNPDVLKFSSSFEMIAFFHKVLNNSGQSASGEANDFRSQTMPWGMERVLSRCPSKNRGKRARRAMGVRQNETFRKNGLYGCNLPRYTRCSSNSRGVL